MKKLVGFMWLISLVIILNGCSNDVKNHNDSSKLLKANEINLTSTTSKESYLIKDNTDIQNIISMLNSSEYQKAKLDIKEPDFYIDISFQESKERLLFWASENPIFKYQDDKSVYYLINKQDYEKVSHLFIKN